MKTVATQRQRDELARRKAMGIAMIQRPLKFIAAKTNTVERDMAGNVRVVTSPSYELARQCASQGNGGLVNRIARTYM